MLVDTGGGEGDLMEMVRTLTVLPLFVINTHGDPGHTGCNAQFETAYLHPAEYNYYEENRRQGDHTELLPVWDGQRMEVGDYRFEVLLIPGHTPGSIALWEPRQGILLPGDSVQHGVVNLFGRGRNLRAYLASLEKLERLGDAVKMILPSHGGLPVSGKLLGQLVQCAELVLAGQIPGKEAGYGPLCRLYSFQQAQLLCPSQL